MEDILLSILICTTNKRTEYLDTLLTKIYNCIPLIPYKDAKVEILVNYDDCTKTIGTKRNELVTASKGTYVVFLDDDDLIDETYFLKVINEMRFNSKTFTTYKDDSERPDIISYKLVWFQDNEMKAIWDLMAKPNMAQDRTAVRLLHICPIKRELVLQVPYIDANKSEDCIFSDKIVKLIKTERHIAFPLYYYYLRTDKSSEVTSDNIIEPGIYDVTKIADYNKLLNNNKERVETLPEVKVEPVEVQIYSDNTVAIDGKEVLDGGKRKRIGSFKTKK